MIGERVFERFGGRLSSDSSATPMGSQGTQCAGQCEEGGSEENKERSSSDLQCEESAVSDPSLLCFLSEVPEGIPRGSEEFSVRD